MQEGEGDFVVYESVKRSNSDANIGDYVDGDPGPTVGIQAAGPGN